MAEQATVQSATDIVIRRLPLWDFSAEELPPGFAPLHLVLSPGSLCLELAYPDLIAGRLSTADIRLPLPDISRRHCRFRFAFGQWDMIDLNSLNGTYVNGKKRRESMLREGDEVRIGGLTFSVRLPQFASQGAAATQQLDSSDRLLRQVVESLPPAASDSTPNLRRAS